MCDGGSGGGGGGRATRLALNAVSDGALGSFVSRVCV